MADKARAPSARQEQLLEAAYDYTLKNGLSELSLRPLAGAIGTSPRVLLYLYGSKEELVRAILARARHDELGLLNDSRLRGEQPDLAGTLRATWQWLAAEEHRPLLCLWVEAYARSLNEPGGPWADFARQTVEDWLSVLAGAQPSRRRRTTAGLVERTAALAVLRGALLDRLATGDGGRTTAAVDTYIRTQLPPIKSNPSLMVGKTRL